jgi:hypothetical protein
MIAPNYPEMVSLWQKGLGSHAKTEAESTWNIAEVKSLRLPGEQHMPGLATFRELPRIRYYADRGRVVEDLRTAFGASTVIIGDYEDGWHMALGPALGLHIADDEGSERHRESISDDLAQSIRALNELGLPVALRQRILAALVREEEDRNGLRLVLALRTPGVLESFSAAHTLRGEFEDWISSNLVVDDYRWGVVDEVRDLIARHC